ncbi:MAG: MFS transporter [Gammaproteobacteria bacterium]|nr:MFS transporter [Gammaproteobacteria bacterium]
MSQQSQFALLKKRRFMPFLLTQFLGAFNDNIYKNSLMLMVAFAAAESLTFNSALFINLAAGLFILPFFLFSSIAGQLADKYEKSLMIRRIKLLEIAIMLLASVFILTQNYVLMLALLFLMGAQSAFFGPIKYAIIPQHLRENELVGGNALVEMSTFVAILAGTLGAGLLMEIPEAKYWIAGVVVLLAVLGWLASRKIPTAKAAVPELKVNWNSFTQALQILADARKDRAVFQSILAISWFWALGAAYLTQLPNLASDVLRNAHETTSWFQ